MWNYRLPALVSYKNRLCVAYRFTKRGSKVKLFTWNLCSELEKLKGTPEKASTKIEAEFDVRSFNGHDYFKVKGKIISCSTGEEMKDGNILALFANTEETVYRHDPAQGIYTGRYEPRWLEQDLQDQEAAAIHAASSDQTVASASSSPNPKEVKMVVKDVKETLQHLVDVERIIELSSNKKVSGQYGRDYHMIRVVSKGRPYKVFRMDKGKDNKEVIDSLRGHLILAVDRQDSIIFAVSEEPTTFLGWFKDFGFKILKGAKTSKRLSQLIRPFLMFADFNPNNWKFRFLNKENYHKDFKLVDGAIVISTRAFKTLLAVSVNRLMATDPEAAHLVQEMGNENLVFNGRLWLPGRGFIKGQFFVSSKIDVDFIIHEENITKEVLVNTKMAYLGMDPQPGKLSLESNGQICNNVPQTFGIGLGVPLKDNPLYKRVVETCERALVDLKEGKIEDSLKELLVLLQNNRITESETTRARLELAKWADVDNVRSNPALLGRVAKVGLERMVDIDELNINVRVDGGTNCQTVSEAVMELLGVSYTIQKGTVQYNPRWMVYIENDQDFLENLENHGGNDNDDKFGQILLRQSGFDGIRCFMYRNPSDRGEYNVLTFVGEPPVKVSSLVLPAKMPLKLTERDWKLPVVPSKLREKQVFTGEWDIDDFYSEISTEGTNPGLGINVGSLWNASNPDVSLRNRHMPASESVVDSSVQLKDGEDITFIKKCMIKVMHEVLTSNWLVDHRRLRNCKVLFKDKGHYAEWVSKLKKQGRLPESGNWWTRLVTECHKVVQETIAKIDEIVESSRIRNNYNLLSPLNASQLQMVARYAAKMMRVQGLCGRTPETKDKGLRNAKDHITQKGHDWIASNMKVHFNKLVEQFTAWGLDEVDGDPMTRTNVRVAIALAHVVNNHAFPGREKPVTDWLMNRKEFSAIYFRILKRFKSV